MLNWSFTSKHTQWQTMLLISWRPLRPESAHLYAGENTSRPNGWRMEDCDCVGRVLEKEFVATGVSHGDTVISLSGKIWEKHTVAAPVAINQSSDSAFPNTWRPVLVVTQSHQYVLYKMIASIDQNLNTLYHCYLTHPSPWPCFDRIIREDWNHDDILSLYHSQRRDSFLCIHISCTINACMLCMNV